jgi:membrane protein implicated in regulation of membrane protease activity
VFLLIAAGALLLGSHALGTGCIRLMRGRHGPGVLHCAPDPSYWIATTLSLLLGALLVVVGWKFLRIARSARAINAARR